MTMMMMNVTRLVRPAILCSLALALVASSVADADAQRRRGQAKQQLIILDGIPERVYWNDGDSFRVMSGPRKGEAARLKGYNTLESWGPVHFWMGAHGWDLYRTHREATKVAQEGEWDCESEGTADGYGRILVDCPGLRRELVARGLAHVYGFGDEIPDPELVAVQLRAQNEAQGMWAGGVPVAIITSLHSVDPDSDDPRRREEAYARLADTRTGSTFVVTHTAQLRPCDTFCHLGSCMVYVPFEVRYGDKRPACMRGKAGEMNVMTATSTLNQPLLPNPDWQPEEIFEFP